MTAPVRDRSCFAEDVAASDYWRTTGKSPTENEWYHFCVFAGDVDLIVNLAHIWLDDGPAPVTTVLARVNDEWLGDLVPGRRAGSPGSTGHVGFVAPETVLTFDGNAYRLCGEVLDGAVSFDLVLAPRARPLVASTPRLGYDSQGFAQRMYWAVLPHLTATGRVTIDGCTRTIIDALAYHDHNWGQFVWGGDFAWNWGVFLPYRSDAVLVYAEVASANLSRVLFREVYLWERGELSSVRNSSHDLQLYTHGLLPEPGITVPGVLRTLYPSVPWTLPDHIAITTGFGRDDLALDAVLDGSAQIVVPAANDSAVIFTEAAGTGTLRTVDGTREGRVMWEFNRVRA